MDIVSRLKLFLKQNGIANSQFADTCEIPRPTLSQLLNGRNKKVSDELITKIHTAYPALNIMWLMFGDGDMFVPNQNNSLDFAQPSENLKFGSDSYPISERRNSQQVQISFNENDGNSHKTPSTSGREASQAANDASPSLTDAIQSIARSVGRPTARATQQSEQRRVVSIMVFYSDNSFDTFTPNR